MAGKSLPFPVRPNITESLAADIKSAPSIASLSQEESQKLLGVCKHVYDRGRELIKFVDSKRELAGVSGIETISIELSSLLDTRLRPVFDELEDASRRNRGAFISLEGLDTLRRAETLIAESGSNLSRFMDDRVPVEHRRLAHVHPESGYLPGPLGQVNPPPVPMQPSSSSDVATVAIVSILATGLLAALFVVLFSTKK